MPRKLMYLVLALAAAAASLIPAPKAEAAPCKQICCPGNPPQCISCCSEPCPILICWP